MNIKELMEELSKYDEESNVYIPYEGLGPSLLRKEDIHEEGDGIYLYEQ